MKNSTAVIADFGGKWRPRFFAKSRTPPIPIDTPESQTVVGQGDFWRQGLAMGRALVKPPARNRRSGEGAIVRSIEQGWEILCLDRLGYNGVGEDG
jgi:hypothetical protein